VKALVLFEPPFIVDGSRAPMPDRFLEDVRALIERGRRGDAVASFMTTAVGVPDDMVAPMRRSPMWQGMEARAHTILYDCAVMAGLQGGKPLPAARWKSAGARTLVIDGERSDAFLRSAVEASVAVLPNARRYTLPGADHSAVFTAPQALVPVLAGFLGSEEPEGPRSSRAAGAAKEQVRDAGLPDGSAGRAGRPRGARPGR
jgi:pimeloyl-ACP methyl ester carboxylesterase